MGRLKCGFLFCISVLLIMGCSKWTQVPVIDAPIHDEAVRNHIVSRITQEGVKANVTPDGIIMVKNQKIARQIRHLLIIEDLFPHRSPVFCECLP